MAKDLNSILIKAVRNRRRGLIARRMQAHGSAIQGIACLRGGLDRTARRASSSISVENKP